MKSLAQIAFPAAARVGIYPSQKSPAIFGQARSLSNFASAANNKRFEELREKLRTQTPRYVFELSDQGKNFVRQVAGKFNAKYSRGGEISDGFLGVKSLLEAAPEYYDEIQTQKLLEAAPEIQARMRVKGSEAYLRHAAKIPQGAKKPHPILKVIMPDVGEIGDLSGEVDPSNQNRYSPLPGLLHKYGMALAMVAQDCSSHCRYCYRLDLFNGSSGKTRADMPLIAAYIKTFNLLIEEAIKNFGQWDAKSGFWVHKESKEPLVPIREIVFSGGDPMVLPNTTLARYMVLMAEAGINNIRLGTKDLVFCPERFDENFWKMMDLFHQNYPDVMVDIVGHYVHPFELVEPRINKDGEYVYDIGLQYKIREDVKPVLDEINKRKGWVRHYNQFPLISGINDSPDIIRLILYLNRRLGIEMHNIYACREIPGHQHFRGENTLERQFGIIKQANLALTQIEGRGHLIMSTEYGKFRVQAIFGNEVSLELTRFINETIPDETTIRVDLSKLPQGQEFYWLTDEVIELAVDDRGKKVLEQISNHSNSFITGLKKLAGTTVVEQSQGLEQDQLKVKTTKPCATKLEIKVGGKAVILDFADEVKHQDTKQSEQSLSQESPSNSPQVKARSRVLDENVQKIV
jgi:L-lysine 2,3-aminomutase